jgi:hypothetical protein
VLKATAAGLPDTLAAVVVDEALQPRVGKFLGLTVFGSARPKVRLCGGTAGLPDSLVALGVDGLLIMRRMLQFRGGCFNLEVMRRESFDFF